MSSILFPHISSELFYTYQWPILYYKDFIDIVVPEQEVDRPFFKKLTEIGIELYTYHLNNDNYSKTIKNLINNNQYKVIVPTHNDIYQNLFGFGSFSKPEIYKLLLYVGLKTPILYNSSIKFPVIAKPKIGSGSNGVRRFDNYEALQTFLTEKPYDYNDFGDEYQIEEYIEGPTVNITLYNLNGTVRLLSTYDTETDHSFSYITTQRLYPSKHQDIINSALPKLLDFVSKYTNKNGIVTLDGKIKDGELYIIDVGNRLPSSELSKHLYSRFALEYVSIMMGNNIEISTLNNSTILHKYFPYHPGGPYTGPIPLDNSIKEFKRPTGFGINAWNASILEKRGYIIIESDNPIDKYNEILKFMSNNPRK